MMTINEIAKASKVSIATVSRAINNPASVSPTTLARVQKVIDKMGYAPNKIARSLKSQASKTVGIITSDITNPFLVKILKGAEKRLFDAGYTPIICDSEETLQKEDRYLRDLIERRIDGLILIPVLERLIIPSIIKNIPTVFIDRSLCSTCDCVKGNNFSGIAMLVTHLYNKGCRKMAFVGGPEKSLVGKERNMAFYDIAKELNLSIDPDFVVNSDFTVAGGYETTFRLLKKSKRPDAIISANNLMGIGILKAIRDLKLDKKKEVEIATYDELGELVGAQYSYIQQPAFEMGSEAGKMLLDRMKGGADIPPRLIQFEATLLFNT